MGSTRDLLRGLTPPIVLEAYRKARYGRVRGRYGLRGDYGSWAEASADSCGYGSPAILEKTLMATLAVREGRAAFEQDSVVHDEPSFDWDTLAALLWVAALDKGRLEVLDFGGSLGTAYWRHRTLLDRLPLMRWNVVEQPDHVRAGREHLQSDVLRFFGSISECREHSSPNVLLLGGVLQYLESPYAILDEAAAMKVPYLIVDRTQFWDGPRDVITVQHVPPVIYDASYPCWVFSRQRFFRMLSESGFRVVAELDSWRPGDGSVNYVEGGFVAELMG